MPYVKREALFAPVARLLRGYSSTANIAAAIGKTHKTALSRLESPENLTLGELRMLSMRLHIPKEEIVNAIKW